MVQPPGRESTPLEATLNSWVAWANAGASGGALFQNLQDGFAGSQGFAGLQQSLLSVRLPDSAEEAIDWEGALKRQNAANDELCSENSQLQVELKKLQEEVEALEAEAEAALPKEAEAAKTAADDTEGLLDEIMDQLRDQVQSSLARFSRPTADAGDPTAEMGDPDWSELLSRVEQAVREAETASAAPSAATMAEEVALLVAEKMALREQVERQQERIEVLEDELRQLDVMPPDHLLRDMLSKHVARGLSDAGGALSAGLSAVLAPKGRPEASPVGGEFEVISGRGAIVRSGESLRSEVVGELAPGSRVKVVATSRKYPRRVEIVHVPAEGPGTEETAKARGLVGWISASSKDGRLLIRAVAEEAPEVTQAPAESPKDAGSVTLSQQEWECLNEANASSAQQLQELSTQLSRIGAYLLQSFEMQSVLAQQQKIAGQERERCSSAREMAAMAAEEAAQRRFEARAEVEALQENYAAHEATLATADEEEVEEEEEEEAPPPTAALAESPIGASAIDWERLSSERETTAAALSAGIQRLTSLQREVAELEQEQQRLHAEPADFAPLRQRLRSALRGATKVESPCNSEILEASEGLFRHRLRDLAQHARALRRELRQAREGERTLRGSVAARSDALRGLLHRLALTGLESIPQCGPVRLAPDPDAERAALLAAVQ
ncbi:unnamed protein product, partial [Symbiodinium sp. CCMP2592]